MDAMLASGQLAVTDVARALGVAFARFCGAPRVLVARDMRPSGVELVDAFFQHEQFRPFGFDHAGHGNAGPCAHDFGDFFVTDRRQGKWEKRTTH